LTVADGTNDGGINGAGGGEAGACADAANGIIARAEASAAHTIRLRRVFLRIGLLPFFECRKITNQHLNVTQGYDGQKHFSLGFVDSAGEPLSFFRAKLALLQQTLSALTAREHSRGDFHVRSLPA